MFKSIVVFASLFLLSACTQKFNDVNATLDEAFFGADDVVLSKQQIVELPYASSFVRINGGANLFMVLAFAEKNPETGAMQLKWLSSDKAMIVTEGGRIVKTLGLAEANLSNITPISFSSLPSLASISKNQTTWSAHYDWMLNDHYLFNYKANITPVLRGKSTIETTVWNKDVTEVVEVISIPSLDYSFTNQYWLDEQFNVVKTHQYLGPDIGDIEMTILKPFAL
ncbi:YjbF family lipoprotein [Aliivibrio fischeri]|uniref:YjbF family lipoprotein n=1 Tax=Aliivibrio fischeri TaxID=668 RepID=UPI00080E3BA7|nr:YjbF family lipoprotein [Aliivibrio fischeri]OCH36715.1 hypothetical protein A6E02_18920 [Aliivibrio fischeri]